MQKYLLSVTEAWEFSGLPRDVLYRLIRTGDIKTIKIGRANKVHRLELEKFLDEAAEKGIAL